MSGLLHTLAPASLHVGFASAQSSAWRHLCRTTGGGGAFGKPEKRLAPAEEGSGSHERRAVLESDELWRRWTPEAMEGMEAEAEEGRGGALGAR